MFGQFGLNFETVFEQFGLKFQDCSRKCRTKFSEMFSGVFRLYGKSLESKLAKTDSFYGTFNVYGHFGQFHIILSMSLSNVTST